MAVVWLRVIRPARSSTFRCLEIAGMLAAKGSAQLGDRGLAPAQAREDGAPGGIGQRAKVTLRASSAMTYQTIR
jgi:hypothetical protein